MMLVYKLPSVDAVFTRFVGISGSAYLVGGFGATALTMDNMVVVPIRSGVGLRLGANIGYLKFTPTLDLEPVLAGRSLPRPGAIKPAPSFSRQGGISPSR